MMARLLLALIAGYQRWISPLLGPTCRFEPSCSRYTARCIELHGAGRGALLGAARICRCHPFHPGGYDPPPGDDVTADAERSRVSPASSNAPRTLQSP